VAVGGHELDGDLLLLLTEHAATVCGIILGRERVVAAAAGRARTDLVEGLLLARDRDDGEAERWAGHLGFARGTEHHVLAVGVAESSDRARVLAVAEHTITRARAAAIVAVREGEVVAVVPVERPDSVRELAQRCRRAVRERHPEVAVVAGIGGPCREAREIARSYAEARSAIDAARRMAHAPGVVAYEELGVLRLLLQVPDTGELQAFAVDVLGDLVRDRGAGADLLGTLAEWFRCNGSPQRTARELHVHPNTVTYRIRRVEEIAGLRLDHHRDRLMAQLACEIVQALP
jgi:sugar diacid utilization regulator